MHNRSNMSRRSFLRSSAVAGVTIGSLMSGCTAMIAPTGNTIPSENTEATEIMTSTVTTSKGIVAGQFNGSTGVHSFKGIPYAQSIAGRNRFAPPQPVEPWTGVLQAERYADSSPQQVSELTGTTPVSSAFRAPEYVKPGDDCLALNIWTPDGADGSLPVMVWLHGGGWVSGSGSDFIYDGENLAARGDVVIVTINHRLGASGLTDFSRILGGEFAESSNLGVRDMIAALEWVRDNIAAFGGNPDLVTIFGESGGGWKVSTMLGVPAAKGLFHRAIVESGPLTRFMTPDQADEVATAVLSELGVTPDTAAKLYDLSAEEVVAAEARVLAGMPMTMGAPGFPTGFWPVIDGTLIPNHVFDVNAAPSSLDVPLLIGQNGTEFTLFMLGDQAAYSLDDAGLDSRVAGAFGQDAAPQILDAYRRDFPDYDPSGLWFRIYSDYAMGTLSSEIMDVRSVAGAAPVYAYRFDWQTPILDGKLYSPHTIEIPFVFDNATTEAGIVMTGGGTEAAALAERVSSAWVAFARTGTPTADGLPEWPAYSQDGRASMHIDVTSRVAPYMDPAMVELFHNMLWTQAGLH